METEIYEDHFSQKQYLVKSYIGMICILIKSLLRLL